MKWINQKPTVEGWYWWREHDQSDFACVLHWKDAKDIYIDGCRHKRESLNGQFAGPIPKPFAADPQPDSNSPAIAAALAHYATLDEAGKTRFRLSLMERL